MQATLRRPAIAPSGDDASELGASLNSLLKINAQLARSIGDENERFLLQSLIDQIPDFLFVKDLDSKFIVANAAIATAYGSSPVTLIGKTDFDLHPPSVAQDFHTFEQDIMRTGVPLFNMEESFPDSDGVQKWYSTTKVPLRNPDGTVVGLIGVARDVSERKLLEAFEIQQAHILEMIAKNEALPTVLNALVLMIESKLVRMQASILLFDAESNNLRHGAAPSLPEEYCRVIEGVEIGENVGSCGAAVYRREPVIVTDIQSDPIWHAFKDLASSFGFRSCWSNPIIGHDGRVLGTFAMYSSEMRNPLADEARLIDTATRIAGIAIERDQSEQQLVYMAHHDALTRLPNRVLFLERLTSAIAERRSRSCHVALLYIDLDGFKQINDHLGHHLGDLLLAEVGKRLRTFTSDRVTVARLGGDEFAAIQVLDLVDLAEIEKLASEIVTALGASYFIAESHVVAGATIGIAIAPEDDNDPGALMRDADLALYQAKAEERGAVRFFKPEMSVRAEQRRLLEQDLRVALDHGEFELFYQPLVNLASTSICGFEALLRWHHPRRGAVPPQEFIPVAEEIGLIVALGEWALRQACAQAALWPPFIKIAVNLSPVQFRHRGLFQTVTSALACAGLSPERLELEITESVLLLDSEANLVLLHQLRNLGIQISLDDFGTGYSSLGYLRSFPFTKIKIDRSFVRDVEENLGCLAIVRAVSRLAADLGMKTTAEGVETWRQLEQLRHEGCHEAQGFLFSRPVPAREATSLINTSLQTLDEAPPTPN